MEATVELEPFMKIGLKLLRRTKDPNSLKEMKRHFEEAIQEQYGGRRPTNAAKKLTVPAALLSKELGIEQTEVSINRMSIQIKSFMRYIHFQTNDDESSSSSSSSSPKAVTPKSIVEVCSSPPPTITLEQAKSDPVINIDSDSDMDTDIDSTYSCCVCKYVNNNILRAMSDYKLFKNE